MAKNRTRPPVTSRAWRLLRLALLWARKGGAFKQRLFLDLRLLPSHLRNLRPGGGRRDRLHYGEKEFSFGDTPKFHIKRHRLPRIPCITRASGFDDDDDILLERRGAMKLLEAGGGAGDGSGDGDEVESESGESAVDGDAEAFEEEIDTRAERFIMEFYEQIKVQREMSWLEYHEMLRRGMC
ncbi:hypothetical protein HPP92_024906 [Vanilla planifolia]|uniref:Uncharacterized protein n=1 Tax=Vanilla planifolia TaxID=51239 RepID=A0A835PL72_VANPL|nr:hypothetical protein HPP92_024906 [Vanilla planifolia]